MMKKLLVGLSVVAMGHAAAAQGIVVPLSGQTPPPTPAGQQQLINGTPWVNGRGLVQGSNWRDNYQIIHDILNGMGSWDSQGHFTPNPSTAPIPAAQLPIGTAIASYNDPRFTTVSARDPQFATNGALYGDGQQASCTASIAKNTTSLAVSGSACSFAASDVGKKIRVQGAGTVEGFGTLASIPVATNGDGYTSMPSISVSGGDGAAKARPIMSAKSVTVSYGGANCGGSSTYTGTMLFAVQPNGVNSGNGRPVVVSGTVTNGVLGGALTVVDAGSYFPPTGGSPIAGIPYPSNVQFVPVAAVAKAQIGASTVSGFTLSNIQSSLTYPSAATAPYANNMPTTPFSGTDQREWINIAVNGVQPYGVIGTLDANYHLTGLQYSGGNGGYGINGPGADASVGIVVPVPIANQCAANPALNIDFILSGVTVQDAGAQLTNTGTTVSISGGSPTTAATLGAPAITPVTEYLQTTITAVNDANHVTLSSAAGADLNNSSAIINWFHDDQLALQLCLNSLKPCLVPPGTYWLGSQLTMPSFGWLTAASYLTTTLKLAAGTDDDLISSANYASLCGSNSTTTTDGTTLSQLTLDGNPGAQVQWNPDRQNLIEVYGSGMNWQQLRTAGAKGHGMRTCYLASSGPGGGTFNAIFSAPGAYFGRNGWDDQGPHDQQGDTISFLDVGQEGDDTWVGIKAYGGASGTIKSAHPYSSSYTPYHPGSVIADYVGMRWPYMEAEGGRNDVYCAAGCQFGPGAKLYFHYGSPYSAEEIVTGNGAVHNGVSYSTVAHSKTYAVQFGLPNASVSGSLFAQITTQGFVDFGPFDMNNSACGNVLQGSGVGGGGGFPPTNYGATSVAGYNPACDLFSFKQTAPTLNTAARVSLPTVAVAGLPVCTAANQGDQYGVSNSSTTTPGATITAPSSGGGSYVVGVCNGTNFTVH